VADFAYGGRPSNLREGGGCKVEGPKAGETNFGAIFTKDFNLSPKFEVNARDLHDLLLFTKIIIFKVDHMATLANFV
jgi:hypothetical protein